MGGYFELELRQGNHYHADAIRLNSGTNAFEYILRSRKYRKVHIPYYTCEAMLVPLERLNIEYAFYSIDRHLEPTGLPSLGNAEAFLYTDYFGLKHPYVEQLTSLYGDSLIVDNTQAFYAMPCNGVDTFYSARKFFGVPDGAYLYTDSTLPVELEQDRSHDRCSHLLKRIDLGAPDGYADFQCNTQVLADTPLRLMSRLTETLLGNIDYEEVRTRRIANYYTLEAALRESNQLKLTLTDGAVPLVYPYLPSTSGLKQRLIEEHIFVATYWPNVLQWRNSGDWEHTLAQNACFLPVDQRYGDSDMHRICNVILSHHE
ncbi:MAG: hypothetical protein J6I49_03995 [Bacteroidales bacterium]|nr:hypothetical protein [Bacteroidales bacterium]